MDIGNLSLSISPEIKVQYVGNIMDCNDALSCVSTASDIDVSR